MTEAGARTTPRGDGRSDPRSYTGSVRRLLLALAIALIFPATALAKDPVVAAAERTASARSSTVRLHVTQVVPGTGRVVMTGSGVQRGMTVSLHARTRGPGVTFTLDVVGRNERGAYVMYMRSPVFRSELPPGKTWIRIDLQQQGANLGIDFGSLLSSSQAFPPLAHGLVATSRLGTDTVAGKRARHFRVVVDHRRAASRLPGYAKQLAAIERATGVALRRVTQDVWVGPDGRIRQLRYSTPTPGGGRATQTLTYLNYDKPVTISAPPRATVFTLPS
jgi:hypothetical protein